MSPRLHRPCDLFRDLEGVVHGKHQHGEDDADALVQGVDIRLLVVARYLYY